MDSASAAKGLASASTLIRQGPTRSISSAQRRSAARSASAAAWGSKRRVTERTGRDSNPRYPYGHTGFRDRRLQPLGHLSNERTQPSYVQRVKQTLETDSRMLTLRACAFNNSATCRGVGSYTALSRAYTP